MNKVKKTKWFAWLFIVLAASIVSSIAISGNWLASIENRTWDLRAKLIATSRKADLRIKLITIDQASLDFYAKEEGFTWPWPRSLYVPVIRFLEEAGASGVAFDLIFTESSVSGVKDDEELAQALVSSIPIVSSVVLKESLSDEAKNKNAVTKRELFYSKLKPKAELSKKLLGIAPHKFEDITLPVPEIVQTGEAFGAVNGIPDKDGIFRHVFRGGMVQGTPILSLPFSLFQATQELGDLSFLNAKDLVVNLNGTSGTYPTENIANIINSYVLLSEGKKPVVDPSFYRDAFVFIGAEAPGLLDLRPTSISEVFRGVEFHASVFDNLLHKNFIQHTPESWGIFLTTLVAGILSGALLFTHKIRSHIGWIVLSLTGFFAIEIYAAYLGFWLPLAVPLICIIGVTILSLGIQYQLEGKQHRFIQGAFQRYVNPQVINEIIKNPSILKLGGERKELTIFFSDIQGFSSISEKMDPSKLVSFLNKYLSEMTDIILGSGGTLDKYEGDAIIAFWNAPLPVEDHVNAALVAAVKCQKRLTELKGEFFSEYGVQPHTRIGIHTGEVTVGNFGSKDRFDYSIIGDAANLASRLEGVNKVFGTSIAVSEVVKSRSLTKMRRLGKVQVVGKDEIIDVYEPIGEDHLLSSEEISRFEDGLFAFESGRVKVARDIFLSLKGDPPSEKYLERIKAESSGTSLWKLTGK